MRILCTLAQRNEVACLEPWVRYHAYMVGKENIHIIDNASDVPYVVDKIAEYESLGIGVTRISPGTNLAERGFYTSNVINSLEERMHFDFIFPMDCDEFLAVYDHSGHPSCDRSHIYRYLKGLSRLGGTFETRDGLENVNGVVGRFVKRDYWKKAFFSYRQCVNLDVGYHVGTPRNGLPAHKTDMVYVHYHIRPYDMFRRLARQKLESFVNPDDREALAAHVGANFHLVELYLKTEDEYNKTLNDSRLYYEQSEIDFSELIALQKIIGIDPRFLEGK